MEDIESGEKYKCEISESVISKGIELTIDHFYAATFQEITSINPATGEEKIERTVIDLSKEESGIIALRASNE